MEALYWYDGQWLTENPKLLGPSDHAFWMASMVFDGARAFAGLTPDLDLHCQRVVRSAEKMLMKPALPWQRIQELCLEAVARFPAGSELYIKPMFFCADGFLLPDAEQTQFVLHVFKVPPARRTRLLGLLLQLRAFLAQHGAHRRQGVVPVPNGQRAIREANLKGLRQRHHGSMARAMSRGIRHQPGHLWIALQRPDRHAGRQRHSSTALRASASRRCCAPMG